MAERAAALNPMDGNSIAFLGELMTYAGDSDRGCAWRDAPSSSIPIIPDGTGSSRTTMRTARGTTAARSRSPSRSICRATGMSSAVIAAAYGQLGERDAARTCPAGVARDEAGLCCICARGFWKVARPRRAPRTRSRRSPQGGPGHPRLARSAQRIPGTARVRPPQACRSQTNSPPTIVLSTGTLINESGSTVAGSSPRTTRSASLPGVMLPFLRSSKDA